MEKVFKKYQQRVEEALKSHMPALGAPISEGGTALREACEYALLNGGKRFRPTLVYMVSDALAQGRDPKAAALAVEYFHTASLIADDLPCMDDDDERRNKPSVHKIYGEATALLASYALIAAGYGLIAAAAQQTQPGGSIVAIEALSNAALNTGVFGATGGQFLDINPPNLSEKTLRDVIHKKTVSLFEISFVFGWLFGGGDHKALAEIKRCASHFGMAFQIADDLGDVEQDVRNGRKINMAGVFGVEAAQQMFHKEIAGYRMILQQLGIASKELLGLASVLEKQVEMTTV